MAIPIVLVIATVLTILVTILLKNYSKDAHTFTLFENELKAKYQALGAIQFCILKIKFLPEEFYEAYKNFLVNAAPTDTVLNPPTSANLFIFYFDDYNETNLSSYTIRDVVYNGLKLVGEGPIYKSSGASAIWEQDIIQISYTGKYKGTEKKVTRIINISRQIVP
ncbi:hypothetical protein KAJ27_19680 [bacterium]|nr:hypothetical protein [bacterium]